MKKNKSKKPTYVDDGHTIYDMSNVPSASGKKRKDDGVEVTKKERRAMLKAAYAKYLPVLAGIVCCFLAAAALLWLWLN